MRFTEITLVEASSNPFEELPDEDAEKGNSPKYLKKIKAHEKHHQMILEIARRQLRSLSASIMHRFDVIDYSNVYTNQKMKQSLDSYIKDKQYLLLDFHTTKYIVRNTPEAVQFDKKINKLLRRIKTETAVVQTFKQEVTQLTKQLADERRKADALAALNTIVKVSEVLATEPAKVPKKLPKMLGLPPSLDNPYYMSGTHAAGLAKDVVLAIKMSSTFKKYYLLLSDALERNHLPGFTVMYYGAYGAQAITNFITYAVEGRLVWRKYDVGGGSGQNWLYVDGRQMVNPFTTNDKAKQDELLRKWFPEYFKEKSP